MINIQFMRKNILLGLFFGFFVPLTLVAQTREDAVAIATAMWETRRIANNVEVRQMRWPLLYGCAQTVTVVEITPKHGVAFDVAVADGGATRFESVRNGLALIPNDAQGVVAVHDGVRPMVSVKVIERCFAMACKTQAVIPVTPVVETLRQIMPDGASQTVNRDAYRLVQTPQTFDLQLLKQAYQQPYSTAFTDDASVVEALGMQITMVEGNIENIKITTPFDLDVCERLLHSPHLAAQ